MSDTKRTIEDIHREYSQKCTEAGHLWYQTVIIRRDLETQLNAFRKGADEKIAELEASLKAVESTLVDLNMEAAKVQAESSKPSESESV